MYTHCGGFTLYNYYPVMAEMKFSRVVHPRTLLLRLIKFTVLISVCTHFVACLWYILGCQAGTCRSGTWAGTASLVNTTIDDADHYLNSLYWSMATMTTTGTPDIMPWWVSLYTTHN